MANPTMELNRNMIALPNAARKVVSATGATIIAPEGGMINQNAVADSKHYLNVPASVADKIRELAELPQDRWGTARSRQLRIEDLAQRLDKLSRAILQMLEGRRPAFRTESATERKLISKNDVLVRLAQLRESILIVQRGIEEIPIAPRGQLMELARECRLTVALYREYQKRFRIAESRFLSPGLLRWELANTKGGGSIWVAQSRVYATSTGFTKDGNF